MKDPQTAIPKGTFLAIGITSVVYLIVAWMNGMIVLRNAPGSPNDFATHLSALSIRDNGTFACGAGNVTTNMTTNTDFLIYCTSPSSSFVPSFNLSSARRYVDRCEGTVGLCRNLSCVYGSGSATELIRMCAANDMGNPPLNNKTCQFGLLNYYQVCPRAHLIQ